MFLSCKMCMLIKNLYFRKDKSSGREVILNIYIFIYTSQHEGVHLTSTVTASVHSGARMSQRLGNFGVWFFLTVLPRDGTYGDEWAGLELLVLNDEFYKHREIYVLGKS